MYEELVRGRHHVIGCLERYVALRELKRHVLLLVETVCELRAVVVLLGVHTVSVVSVPEEVRIEVGGGPSAHSEAVAVNEVLGDEGVDRPEVELALGA